MPRTTIPLVAAALLVALAAVGGVALGGAAAQEGPPEPTDAQRPPSDGANFTVTPWDAQSHKPGTTSATYGMFSKGEGPWGGSEGLREIDHYKITSQQATFGDCTPQNARAFGIDRDNDASGTTTDTGLLSHMAGYSIDGHVIAVEIYDEGALGGSPTYLNDTDETVAVLADCVVNNGEPGWYQFTGYVNGTNYRGNFQEVTLYSEYFYVCDCADRQEARQQLGPPPHSGGSGGGGGPTPTPTPTPADSTPTPTPTAAGGGGGGSAATATPTPRRGGDAPTATAGRDAQRSTPTAAPAGGGGSRRAASPTATQRITTPTIADGPGFGAVAAALGAALLLLGRR